MAIDTVSSIEQGSRAGHIGYRADIDGLRAVSVVSVILYHLAPNRFPAGGIGVDIFFVISGYLIGGIVLSSLGRGIFSYRNFYMSRARRILPALFSCIAVSTLVSFILLYPSEFTDFSHSAAYALIGASNIYFYSKISYFAPSSTTMPLLHTWTLGVEEQFYLILPPFVGLIVKLKKTLVVAALLILFALSLYVSQYQVLHDSEAAFYLLPSRAWELAAGVLASQLRSDLLKNAGIRIGAGAVGLALICGSLLLIRPDVDFPGVSVLPPVLGAVLVLVSGGGGSAVHRLLGIMPMRFVGLASYSLYLWHWPILVFVKLQEVRSTLSPVMAGVVLLMTAIVGFASWKFIEVPTRSRQLKPRTLLIGLAALFVLLLASQLAVVAFKGLPRRIPATALRIFTANATATIAGPVERCVLNRGDAFSAFDKDKCLSVAAAKPNWLLVGDSHAAMLYHGLTEQVPGIHVQTAAVLGCDVLIHAEPDGEPCGDLMHFVFSDYIWRTPIKGVIFTGRPEVLAPAELDALGARLKAQGKTLLVIGPTPGYSMPVSRVLAEAWRRHNPELPAAVMDGGIRAKDQLLRRQAGSGNFAYVSPMEAMCPDGRHCRLTDRTGRPLYMDGDHYTAQGSVDLWQHMIAADRTSGGALAGTLFSGYPEKASPQGRQRTAAFNRPSNGS